MSSRILSSVLTDRSISAADARRMRVAQDRERLGVGLAINLQAHRIRARRRDGSHFAGFGSPVRDGPRVGIAKARLFPDVRIVGCHRAQGNDARRVIAQIPLHAVDADDEILSFSCASSLRTTFPCESRISNSTVFLRHGLEREIEHGLRRRARSDTPAAARTGRPAASERCLTICSSGVMSSRM